MSLTNTQTRVLEFIRTTIRQNQLPPTRREIAEHFGWRSENSAQDHLIALERKGAIARIHGARGIRLVEQRPSAEHVLKYALCRIASLSSDPQAVNVANEALDQVGFRVPRSVVDSIDIEPEMES
jgi:SOS-response transcriptional repressor LexA